MLIHAHNYTPVVPSCEGPQPLTTSPPANTPAAAEPCGAAGGGSAGGEGGNAKQDCPIASATTRTQTANKKSTAFVILPTA